jgi:hypothetical protein
VSVCTATTRTGRRCRNPAAPDSDRCRRHRELPSGEQVETFLNAVRSGSYLEVAAAHVGVDLRRLLAVPGITGQLEAARATAEVREVALVTQAASTSWQAAAWLLERRVPERWGRPAPRAEEKPEPIAPPTDSLDELAAKRTRRRAAR